MRTSALHYRRAENITSDGKGGITPPTNLCDKAYQPMRAFMFLGKTIKLHNARDALRRARSFDLYTQKYIAKNLWEGISVTFDPNFNIDERISVAEKMYNIGMDAFNSSKVKENQVEGKLLFSFMEACNEYNYDGNRKFSEIIRQIISFIQDCSEDNLSNQLRDFYRTGKVFTFTDTDISIRKEHESSNWEISWSEIFSEDDMPAVPIIDFDPLIGFHFNNNRIVFEFQSNRNLSIPLDEIPKLKSATPEQIKNFESYGVGEAIYWPDIGVYVSAKDLVAGRPIR